MITGNAAWMDTARYVVASPGGQWPHMSVMHAPDGVLDASLGTATAPLVVLFERDDAIAVPLLSQIRIAGYDVRAARTPVELFSLLSKQLVAIVLVDLGVAAAGRREFWVAMDAQRRGRPMQVMTFRFLSSAYDLDPDFDPAARALADVEVRGATDFQKVVDAVRQRIPLHSATAGPASAQGGIAPIGAALGVPSPFAQPANANANLYHGQIMFTPARPVVGQTAQTPPGNQANGAAAWQPSPAPSAAADPFSSSLFSPAQSPLHSPFTPTAPVLEASPDALARMHSALGQPAAADASPFAYPAGENPFAAEVAASPFAQPYSVNPFADAAAASDPRMTSGGNTGFGGYASPSTPMTPAPQQAFNIPEMSMHPGFGPGFTPPFSQHLDPRWGQPSPAESPAWGHNETPQVEDVWTPPDGGFDAGDASPTPLHEYAGMGADMGRGFAAPERAAQPFETMRHSYADEPMPMPTEKAYAVAESRVLPGALHGPTAPVPVAGHLPVVRSQTEQALGSVLVEGALLSEQRLEALRGVQQMLSNVNMPFKLGELALLFKFLSPDQLLAAVLVSRGLVSPQQIAALGRVKQELAASGMDHDLASLLLMFHILPAEQLQALRAELAS